MVPARTSSTCATLTMPSARFTPAAMLLLSTSPSVSTLALRSDFHFVDNTHNGGIHRGIRIAQRLARRAAGNHKNTLIRSGAHTVHGHKTFMAAAAAGVFALHHHQLQS